MILQVIRHRGYVLVLFDFIFLFFHYVLVFWLLSRILGSTLLESLTEGFAVSLPFRLPRRVVLARYRQ